MRDLYKKIIQYSIAICSVLFLFFLSYIGWSYWENNSMIRASQLYENTLECINKNDLNAAIKITETLQDNYSRTIYPTMASLLIAYSAKTLDQFTIVEKELNWILKNSTFSTYKSLAGARLISTFIDNGDFQKAHDVVNKYNFQSLKALIQEKKGDIYFSQGLLEIAYKEYQKALEILYKDPEQSKSSILSLKMKLEAISDNL